MLALVNVNHRHTGLSVRPPFQSDWLKLLARTNWFCDQWFMTSTTLFNSLFQNSLLTMSLTRILFALNHDNPSIIATGLQEFSSALLHDHAQRQSFGYHGRNNSTSCSISKIDAIFGEMDMTEDENQEAFTVSGLLGNYLMSSPMCEELFAIWSVAKREDSLPLCIEHTTCLNVILHCLLTSLDDVGSILSYDAVKATIAKVELIVSRIIRDHSEALNRQIDQKVLTSLEKMPMEGGASYQIYSLMHCTLGLMLTICRCVCTISSSKISIGCGWEHSSTTLYSVYHNLIVPSSENMAKLLSPCAGGIPNSSTSKRVPVAKYDRPVCFIHSQCKGDIGVAQTFLPLISDSTTFVTLIVMTLLQHSGKNDMGVVSNELSYKGSTSISKDILSSRNPLFRRIVSFLPQMHHFEIGQHGGSLSKVWCVNDESGVLTRPVEENGTDIVIDMKAQHQNVELFLTNFLHVFNKCHNISIVSKLNLVDSNFQSSIINCLNHSCGGIQDMSVKVMHSVCRLIKRSVSDNIHAKSVHALSMQLLSKLQHKLMSGMGSSTSIASTVQDLIVNILKNQPKLFQFCISNIGESSAAINVWSHHGNGTYTSVPNSEVEVGISSNMDGVGGDALDSKSQSGSGRVDFCESVKYLCKLLNFCIKDEHAQYRSPTVTVEAVPSLGGSNISHGTGSPSKQRSDEVFSLVESIFDSMHPSGLTKKEIMKMLSCSSTGVAIGDSSEKSGILHLEVQIHGLLLIKTMLRRFIRITDVLLLRKESIEHKGGLEKNLNPFIESVDELVSLEMKTKCDDDTDVVSAILSTVCSTALFKYLPDLQQLLTMKNKIIREMQRLLSSVGSSTGSALDQALEEMGYYFLSMSILVDIVRDLLRITPHSFSQAPSLTGGASTLQSSSSFDFPKLFDDLLSWPQLPSNAASEQSGSDAGNVEFIWSVCDVVEERPRGFALSTIALSGGSLVLLRKMLILQYEAIVNPHTSAVACLRWMGLGSNKDDVIKMICNCIVCPNNVWYNSVKRSAFSKLLVLCNEKCCSKACSVVGSEVGVLLQIADVAVNTVYSLLRKLKLFETHVSTTSAEPFSQKLDVEWAMHVEVWSWIDIMMGAGEVDKGLTKLVGGVECDATADPYKVAMALDILLKLSIHYNVEYCMTMADAMCSSQVDRFPDKSALISPVLCAAMCLSCGNFVVQYDAFPSFIQKHISNCSAQSAECGNRPDFFSKYADGFQRFLCSSLLKPIFGNIIRKFGVGLPWCQVSGFAHCQQLEVLFSHVVSNSVFCGNANGVIQSIETVFFEWSQIADSSVSKKGKLSSDADSYYSVVVLSMLRKSTMDYETFGRIAEGLIMQMRTCSDLSKVKLNAVVNTTECYLCCSAAIFECETVKLGSKLQGKRNGSKADCWEYEYPLETLTVQLMEILQLSSAIVGHDNRIEVIYDSLVLIRLLWCVLNYCDAVVKKCNSSTLSTLKQLSLSLVSQITSLFQPGHCSRMNDLLCSYVAQNHGLLLGSCIINNFDINRISDFSDVNMYGCCLRSLLKCIVRYMQKKDNMSSDSSLKYLVAKMATAINVRILEGDLCVLESKSEWVEFIEFLCEASANEVLLEYVMKCNVSSMKFSELVDSVKRSSGSMDSNGGYCIDAFMKKLLLYLRVKSNTYISVDQVHVTPPVSLWDHEVGIAFNSLSMDGGVPIATVSVADAPGTVLADYKFVVTAYSGTLLTSFCEPLSLASGSFLIVNSKIELSLVFVYMYNCVSLCQNLFQKDGCLDMKCVRVDGSIQQLVSILIFEFYRGMTTLRFITDSINDVSNFVFKNVVTLVDRRSMQLSEVCVFWNDVFQTKDYYENPSKKSLALLTSVVANSPVSSSLWYERVLNILLVCIRYKCLHSRNEEVASNVVHTLCWQTLLLSAHYIYGGVSKDMKLSVTNSELYGQWLGLFWEYTNCCLVESCALVDVLVGARTSSINPTSISLEEGVDVENQQKEARTAAVQAQKHLESKQLMHTKCLMMIDRLICCDVVSLAGIKDVSQNVRNIIAVTTKEIIESEMMSDAVGCSLKSIRASLNRWLRKHLKSGLEYKIILDIVLHLSERTPNVSDLQMLQIGVDVSSDVPIGSPLLFDCYFAARKQVNGELLIAGTIGIPSYDRVFPMVSPSDWYFPITLLDRICTHSKFIEVLYNCEKADGLAYQLPPKEFATKATVRNGMICPNDSLIGLLLLLCIRVTKIIKGSRQRGVFAANRNGGIDDTSLKVLYFALVNIYYGIVSDSQSQILRILHILGEFFKKPLHTVPLLSAGPHIGVGESRDIGGHMDTSAMNIAIADKDTDFLFTGIIESTRSVLGANIKRAKNLSGIRTNDDPTRWGGFLFNNSWWSNVLQVPVVYSTLAHFPGGVSAESISPSYDVKYWVPVAHYCLLQCKYSNQNPQNTTETEGNANPKKAAKLASLNPCANDISMRSFVNTGFLSILLLALCDSDDKIRAQVLVCLDMVLMLLRTQTHDVDSLFRERPQIIHLLEYVKGSIHIVVNGDKGVEIVEDNDSSNFNCKGKKRHADQFLQIVIPRLPVTMCLFLAEAALHLMQPVHGMYSRINKYILSKPYCDVKDVPLFDILFVNNTSSSGESQLGHYSASSANSGLEYGNAKDRGGVSTERLYLLRIIRNGLVTTEDHLNMCRKHGYIRLMSMFTIYCKHDVRLGLSILDIFEKGLDMRGNINDLGGAGQSVTAIHSRMKKRRELEGSVASSSTVRYLVTKCNILTWLFQMINSALNDLRLHVADNASNSNTHGGTCEAYCKYGGIGNFSGVEEVIGILLSRLIRLMRKVLNVSLLLDLENISSFHPSRAQCQYLYPVAFEYVSRTCTQFVSFFSGVPPASVEVDSTKNSRTDFLSKLSAFIPWDMLEGLILCISDFSATYVYVQRKSGGDVVDCMSDYFLRGMARHSMSRDLVLLMVKTVDDSMEQWETNPNLTGGMPFHKKKQLVVALLSVLSFDIYGETISNSTSIQLTAYLCKYSLSCWDSKLSQHKGWHMIGNLHTDATIQSECYVDVCTSLGMFFIRRDFENDKSTNFSKQDCATSNAEWSFIKRDLTGSAKLSSTLPRNRGACGLMESVAPGLCALHSLLRGMATENLSGCDLDILDSIVRQCLVIFSVVNNADCCVGQFCDSEDDTALRKTYILEILGAHHPDINYSAVFFPQFLLYSIHRLVVSIIYICLKRCRGFPVPNHSIGSSIPKQVWTRLCHSVFDFVECNTGSTAALVLKRWSIFGAFYFSALNLLMSTVSFVDSFRNDSNFCCSYADNLNIRHSSAYDHLHRLGKSLFASNDYFCSSHNVNVLGGNNDIMGPDCSGGCISTLDRLNYCPICWSEYAPRGTEYMIPKESPYVEKSASKDCCSHKQCEEHKCDIGCAHSNHHDGIDSKKYRLPAFFRPLSAPFSGISINELRKRELWPLKSYKNQL